MNTHFDIFTSHVASRELANASISASETFHPLSIAAANLLRSPLPSDQTNWREASNSFAVRDQAAMERDLAISLGCTSDQGIIHWIKDASIPEINSFIHWNHGRYDQLQYRLDSYQTEFKDYAMTAFSALKNIGLYSPTTLNYIEDISQGLSFKAVDSLEVTASAGSYHAGSSRVFFQNLFNDKKNMDGAGHELLSTLIHEYGHIADISASTYHNEVRAEHTAVVGWGLMNNQDGQPHIVRPSKRNDDHHSDYEDIRELSGMLMEMGDLDADVLTNSEASYGKHAVRLETLLGTIYSDIMELPTNAYSQLTDYYNQASPRDKKTRLGAVIRHLQHRMDQPAAYETPIDRELAQMAYHYALPV